MERTLPDLRDRFFGIVYSSRLSAVIYHVVSFNALILGYSIVCDTDDYSGRSPVKWLLVSVISGLIAFEIERARQHHRQTKRARQRRHQIERAE